MDRLKFLHRVNPRNLYFPTINPVAIVLICASASNFNGSARRIISEARARKFLSTPIYLPDNSRLMRRTELVVARERPFETSGYCAFLSFRRFQSIIASF